MDTLRRRLFKPVGGGREPVRHQEERRVSPYGLTSALLLVSTKVTCIALLVTFFIVKRGLILVSPEGLTLMSLDIEG